MEEAPSPAEEIPSLSKRTSKDIQHTTKRTKPPRSLARVETSEIEKSLEDEEWREPTTPGAGYGDMGSNGPVLSADTTAQSEFLRRCSFVV